MTVKLMVASRVDSMSVPPLMLVLVVHTMALFLVFEVVLHHAVHYEVV